MTHYKNLHLWLLIPFAVLMLGFMRSFWLDFANVPWRQHLHGLTATGWFILLIIQPYLVTRGHVRQHRWFGMLALILAGAVIASALGTIPYNLINERLPPVARYGLSFVDVVLVTGFTAAVAMAIKNSSNVHDHARWMVSTVFWALAPATFRLSFVPLAILGVENLGDKVALLLAFSGLANIIAVAVLMFRDGRMHPAYLSAASGNIVMFLPMSVGNLQWWRTLADTLFTI